MPFIMREGFDEQLPSLGHLASIGLHLKPLAYFVGKACPAGPVRQHLPHAPSQMRGQRQPRTHIAWDVGRWLRCGADYKVKVLDRFHLKRHSGKSEGVAGAERRGEGFFNLAQFAPVAEPDLQHRRVHDDACIEPVLGGKLRMR